jgi:hypothetical protein
LEKLRSRRRSAVVSHKNFVVEDEHSLKSVFLGLLPYYGGEWKSSVLIDLCFSCHLVAVHQTVTWEFDRTDVHVYEIIFFILRFTNLALGQLQ